MWKSIVFFVLLTSSAQALNSIAESGEIVPENTYRLGLAPQIKVSDGGGVNFGAFMDRRLREDMSYRTFTSFGDTDFVLGGSIKWIPIPDFESQPAFGGRLRAQYVRESSENFFGFAFDPLISKKFEVEEGTVNAYGALPITGTNHKNSSNTGVNLVFGTEFVHNDNPHMLFGAELGIEAKDSFSYILAFMTFSFDNDFEWIEGK